MCGGTGAIPYLAHRRFGLSPRVRGNQCQMGSHRFPTGSIPACAGEPGATRCRFRHCAVYPRVCGGTRSRRGRMSRWSGLSPRVRGNLLINQDLASGKRSIPACAGEPGAGAGLPGAGAVYPRVCGGTKIMGGTRISDKGLSPRVRGNRSRCTCSRRSPGSIPACAGEP